MVFNGEFELEVKQAIIANVTNTLIFDIPSLKDLSKQSVFQISSKIKPQISL